MSHQASNANGTLWLANVSRRHVLKGLAAGGALVVAARWNLALGEGSDDMPYGADAMPNGWVDNPNVFIRIDSDGSVTIVNHRAEMGQGIRTSLVMVAADELGADWERVSVEQAPGDEERYGNQDTDGSRSMRHFFMPMRRSAAAARQMLEQAAAEQWQVPVEECRTTLHAVVHEASGRELGFGELAAAASQLEVPERDGITLKPDSELRYIGKESGPGSALDETHGRPLAIDGEDIVTGAAIYGADVVFEDMLTAVIARPPVYGATLASVDDSAAREVAGVVEVLTLDSPSVPSTFLPLGGVAVVARNTWAAIQGRQALEIEWDNAPAEGNADYDSTAYREALEQAALAPGRVIRDSGDIAAAMEAAASRIEATYYMPHMAQAPIEPPVAVARLQGGKLEVWAPVQAPQVTRESLAERLGLDFVDVTVNVTLLGGGFGRKSKPDFVLEAADLAKRFPGQAVRVQWTREDDLQHAYFHAVAVEHLEAGLDADGKLQGWLHRSLAPSIASLFGPDPQEKSPFEVGMGLTNLPFDIANLRMENPQAAAHVRIGWFRSVYNLPHAFAIQSFIAELAAAAGRDHRDYLLELLGPARQIDPRSLGDEWNYGEDPERYPIDIGRLRRVVEAATEAADWGRELPEGRGLGLAVHHSFVSYVAVVIEVEVDDQGQVTVHDAVTAIDCGHQVNPDRIRAQMEGSCVMGIGIALHSEITARQGRIEQQNFHQFQIPRMPHAAQNMRVLLVDADSDAAMGGVGEPGLPPVAPALCNAVFAATGKRIRRLPVGDQLTGWR